MKFGKGILEALLARRQDLLGKRQEDARENDDRGDFDDDEVTQRANPHREEGLGVLRPRDLEALQTALEPIFFKEIAGAFKGRRVLYVTTATLPYFQVIGATELPYVVCMGPDVSSSVDQAPYPVYSVLNAFSEPCFRPQSFDAILLPEATCRGTNFITRTAYWSKILAPGGDLYIALPHPQLRFFLPTPELRHKNSRTPTVERIFDRCRVEHLEILSVREICVEQLPAALLKQDQRWTSIKQQYEEVPVILGLHVRKGK